MEKLRLRDTATCSKPCSQRVVVLGCWDLSYFHSSKLFKLAVIHAIHLGTRIRKQRSRQRHWRAQGVTESKWESWDQNAGLCILCPVFLPIWKTEMSVSLHHMDPELSAPEESHSQALDHRARNEEEEWSPYSANLLRLVEGLGWLIWAVPDPTHQLEVLHPFHHLGPLFIWPKILHSFTSNQILLHYGSFSPAQPPKEVRGFPSAMVS